MHVTFPESEPAGFKIDKVFKILNYSSLQNPSASGQAYINKGALLFKFYNFRDDVRIVIDIAKSLRGEYLDYAELDVERTGGARFVQFEGFPTQFLRNSVHCYFELWLLKMSQGRMVDQATAVSVEMKYRP